MKHDIYAEVTNRIITQLEQGVIPWKSPYFSKVGFPRNFATGNPYHGINVFLLGSLRYTSPYFLTFIQAKELGGHIRKGEHGSLVVKYGTYTKESEGAPIADATEEQRKYLKAYTVFHASQVEGIAFPEPENVPELPANVACDRARAMVAGMPKAPAIHSGTAIPCYRRSSDIRPVFLWADESQFFANSYDALFQSTARSSRACTVYLTQNFPSYLSVFGGSNSRAEVEAFVGNLQTKIFHANGDPTTNNWAADSIGKTRQTHYTGGMSEQLGKTAAAGGVSQSAGGHQTVDFVVQPQEFTMLRTGGEENKMKVDGIIFQGGRRWVMSDDPPKKIQNYIRQVFPQVYEGQPR